MEDREMYFSYHLIIFLYAAQLLIWHTDQNKIREVHWKRGGECEDV
jgi:hypothetical protein